MKYILLAIIIVAGVVYIKHHSNTAGEHACALNNANIVTIGDSLANGFGVQEEYSFAIKIPHALGKNPIKIGVDGETSSGLLARINMELSSTPSIAAIIISTGGNDFLHKYDQNATKNNIENIIKISKKYTNCIVMLGVPSGVIGGIAGSVSPIYTDVAAKYDVLLDDKSMGAILKNVDLKVDQIHPNVAGHEIITDNITQLIRKNQ